MGTRYRNQASLHVAVKQSSNKSPAKPEVGTHSSLSRKSNLFLYLPHVRGNTDKIGRILEKHNIKLIFKPFSWVDQILSSVKDKTPLSTPGVYKVQMCIRDSHRTV